MNLFLLAPAGGNVIETKAQELISTISRTKRGDDYVLVAGMIDKESGKISKIFSNFKDLEIKNGDYSAYIQNMQPNLKNIVIDINNIGQTAYNMDNVANLVYTGKNIAAHAEIRALDDLARQTFGNSLVDQQIFDN